MKPLTTILRASSFAAALLLAIAPLEVRAESFKSHQFLEWSREGQEHYFNIAIGMARQIAGQNDETQGNCISDWYFKNQGRAHAHIVSVMESYPDFHPRGIVLAVLEKRCGKLIY